MNQAIPVIPQFLLSPDTSSFSFFFVLIFVETETLRKRKQIYEVGVLSFRCVKSQLTMLWWLYADRTAIQELTVR